MDAALQEIGSDLSEACPSAQLVDYDFSAPFSPLEGITGQASVQPRSRWGPAVQPDLIQNHPSFSHIPIGENMSQNKESLPKANPFGQASKSNLSLGQYTPEEPQSTLKAIVDGKSSQTLMQRIGRSGSMTDNKQEKAPPVVEQETGAGILESKVEANKDENKPAEPSKEHVVGDTAPSTTPEQGGKGNGDHKVETDPSDSSEIKTLKTQDHRLDAQDKAEIGRSPLPDIQSHVSDTHLVSHTSDSHIKIGEYVSEVDAPLPSASIHGHSSDAHIKVGENVSEFVAPLPTPNIHGHASDAHIKVGEHVSEVVVPLPSPSIHGHTSDAHIKVGENVSEVVTPLPVPSIHGHSSDANIKVGEFVSNIPESKPRWSKHGHASDCTLQPGCVVSGTEPALAPLPGSSYGHSSDSKLGVGCVVSGQETKRSPLPGSGHGHSSDSSLSVGCVVSKTDPLPSPVPGSIYGHSSDSTLGVGCVVLGMEPQHCALLGSGYGHSSDSSLGVGCVVKGKGKGGQQKTEDNEESKGIEQC